MLSASDSIGHFAHSPSTAAAFLALTAAVVVVVLGRRRGLLHRRRAAALGTGVALAAVLALTLPPQDGWSQLLTAQWDWPAAPGLLRPTRASFVAWRVGTDGPLNVALYLPLAVSLTVLWRRVVESLFACVALSVGIESYQAASGLRVGSAADVVSNGLGALLGVCLGGAVLVATALGTSLTASPRVT